MKIFLDTEFTDFKEKKLISIGLIADNNQLFYLESNDYKIEECSEFVINHVLPLLENEVKFSNEEIKIKLIKWLESFNKDIEVIVDYKTDIELMNKLIGNNSLSNNKLIYKNMYELLGEELKQKIKTIENDENWKNISYNKLISHIYMYINNEIKIWFKDNNKIAHNAMDDAKANKSAYIKAIDFIKNYKVQTNKYLNKESV